jgi:hypothetical protein
MGLPINGTGLLKKLHEISNKWHGIANEWHWISKKWQNIAKKRHGITKKWHGIANKWHVLANKFNSFSAGPRPYTPFPLDLILYVNLVPKGAYKEQMDGHRHW